MIDYLKGSIAEITPTAAVVECCGVGYEVNITLTDYAKAQGAKEAKFYVHESIREDAHVLFGFLRKRDRELFRLLVSVSGVGPGTARLILSAMDGDRLENAIVTKDTALLKSVKGIGAKTAERIILDLKDKINTEAVTLSSQENGNTAVYEDALAALTTLGFPAPACRKALSRLLSANPGISTEDAVKQALKMM